MFDVVGKNSYLHLTAVLFIVFCHLRECVTHDGDNHIEGGDSAEEGGQDEKHEADLALSTVFVFLQRVEGAQGEQVLVHEYVEY